MEDHSFEEGKQQQLEHSSKEFPWQIEDKLCKLLLDMLLQKSPTSRNMAFSGTWKIDRNENYEKFMEAMGVNMMKRKLGAHDNLKITFQQDGKKFTLKESSNFRTIDTEFTLGVDFEYSLADGTELTGSWNMEGNKLVGSFTRKDNGKVLKANREVIGDELVQTYIYEGVEAKRIFKRA